MCAWRKANRDSELSDRDQEIPLARARLGTAWHAAANGDDFAISLLQTAAPHRESRRRVMDGLQFVGPGVIGATGGSGTRVFARIVRDAGIFIGTHLNVSDDALDFGEYSDHWINRYLTQANERKQLQQEMLSDLAATLARHRRALDDRAVPWGWKEPRSIFLLPFFAEHLPEMRFLHVLRDGRDIAYSANQNQLNKHGDAFVGPLVPEEPEPLRAIRLWSALNVRTAEFGERELGLRYLALRFEDLCARPEETIARLLEFFSLSGDPTVLARHVAPPSGLGRWRQQDSRQVAELESAGVVALRKFGYVVGP